MVRWNHAVIEAALIKAFPGSIVRSSKTAGGDHDTREIGIYRLTKEVHYAEVLKGAKYNFVDGEDDADPKAVRYFLADTCVVFGMNDEGCLDQETLDDCEVTLVFACESAKSGMVNATPGDHRLYADVADVLIKLGYHPNNQGWKVCF